MSLPTAAARRLAAALLTALVLAAAPALASQASVELAFEVALSFRPIERFRIGSDETRFGALEFVGGFEMRSPQRDFGQLSSMRFLTPGEDFIGGIVPGLMLAAAFSLMIVLIATFSPATVGGAAASAHEAKEDIGSAALKLARVRPGLHRIGGSHTQRDLFVQILAACQ